MTVRGVDWRAYLGEFHAVRPGITEEVLARCSAEGQTPYAWLVDGLDPAARHLDLACGSGPAHRPGARRWVGVDLAAAELAAAARRGRGPLVRADLTDLPVATDTADVATCSMALMLVEPLGAALAEVHRALAPGGELRLLLPTRAPLTAADRLLYLRLFWAARSPTRFPPTPLRSQARGTLEAAGFEVVSDDRRRHELPVVDATDAARFVDSWYLPGTSGERRHAAAERAGATAPFTIGVPLRRVVARPR